MKWDRTKRTLGRSRQVVLPIAKAGHAVPDADATAQVQVEDVALVEEEHHLCVSEPLAHAHCLPQQVAVLEPVHMPVLHELLVEARDRREEDDHVHVVEGVPLMRTGIIQRCHFTRLDDAMRDETSAMSCT